MSSTPPIVIEAAREKRRRLAAERDELDAKIAELDSYLKSIGVLGGSSRGPKEDPTSLSGQIKAMARKLIVPGSYVPSRQIYEAMQAEGFVFPPGGKPPTERIANVLWKMEEFVGDRVKGWSLRSDQPKTEPPLQGEIQ